MRTDSIEEAERLEAAGLFGEAIERWRAIVADNSAVENLARLGRVCVLHGDSAEGERLLRQTILSYPDYGPAYFYLAAHLYDNGEIDEAVPLLERSLALKPWAAALVLLGNIYDQIGRHDDARRSFEHAIALDRSDEEAWYGLGLIDRFTDVERASKSFSEALKLNPDFGSAHRELAQVLWRGGDLDLAEKHVRTAIRLKEEDAWAHAYLGCILSADRRVAEAEAPFRKALEICPQSTLFCCYLGETLRKLDREIEAEQAFKAALSLDVSDYLANLRMGQLLHDRGRLDQARFYVERARRANPSSRAVQKASRLSNARLQRTAVHRTCDGSPSGRGSSSEGLRDPLKATGNEIHDSTNEPAKLVSISSLSLETTRQRVRHTAATLLASRTVRRLLTMEDPWTHWTNKHLY